MTGPTWLQRLRGRFERRGLVAGLIVACAALVLLALLRANSPFGFAVVGGVLVFDLLILYATQNLAERRMGSVDEREEQLRNRTFRLAYRILSAAICVVGAVVIMLASFGDPGGALRAYWHNTGLVIATGTVALQLLAFFPTVMLAWSQPGDRTL